MMNKKMKGYEKPKKMAKGGAAKSAPKKMAKGDYAKAKPKAAKRKK